MVEQLDLCTPNHAISRIGDRTEQSPTKIRLDLGILSISSCVAKRLQIVSPNNVSIREHLAVITDLENISSSHPFDALSQSRPRQSCF